MFWRSGEGTEYQSDFVFTHVFFFLFIFDATEGKAMTNLHERDFRDAR